MYQITLEEAALRLPQLIEETKSGEEIVITQNSIAVARLVPMKNEEQRPQFGSANKVITYMADDFDAPLDDFADYQ